MTTVCGSINTTEFQIGAAEEQAAVRLLKRLVKNPEFPSQRVDAARLLEGACGCVCTSGDLFSEVYLITRRAENGPCGRLEIERWKFDGESWDKIGGGL